MRNEKNWKLEIRNYLQIAVCVAVLCFCIKLAVAADSNFSIHSIYIDEATIKRGYEVKGFEGAFQIAVFPFVLNAPTRIEMKNRTGIAMAENVDKLVAAGNETGVNAINADAINLPAQAGCVSTTTVDIIASSTDEPKIVNNAVLTPLLIGENPEGWKINSDIYEFDVRDKISYDGVKPLVLTVKYGDRNENTPLPSHTKTLVRGKNVNRQKMFYFDSGKNEWVPLPSTMYEDSAVRAIIHLPYAKLAVFEHNKTMALGYASWYKYKGCNCAASPDYPKGTKLKVTAVNSNKSVIVEVNDYGPDRSVFPERVIDLDMEPFKLLAPPGAGVIDVKVEPVKEICSYAFEKAKHPQSPPPEITAPYAALIDEPTGEIFYQKDGNKKVPIASITKLMTASVFLDAYREKDDDCRDAKFCVSTEEGWDKIIAYNKADDLDGARLYVNNGETMKIKDVFYSMLVGSANNAAKILVRNSGMEYNEFIDAMNEKTKRWDLENTEFRDVTGLDVKNVSAALDVAKMAKEVFKNFEMLQATTMPQYSFKTINTGKLHTIKTTNILFDDKDLYITGAKTGFLDEAGHCLVLKAKNRNNGREVIGVILGAANSEDRFVDMKKLVQWGLGQD